MKKRTQHTALYLIPVALIAALVALTPSPAPAQKAKPERDAAPHPTPRYDAVTPRRLAGDARPGGEPVGR
jgi:hypothetical protein